MVNFNLYKILLNNYFKEMKDYRRIEGIIFVALFFVIFSTMIKTNQFSFWYVIIGIIIYTLLVIEHKTNIYFDKNENTVRIVEKALFQKKYKIIDEANIKDIECANVIRHDGPYSRKRRKKLSRQVREQ